MPIGTHSCTLTGLPLLSLQCLPPAIASSIGAAIPTAKSTVDSFPLLYEACVVAEHLPLPASDITSNPSAVTKADDEEALREDRLVHTDGASAEHNAPSVATIVPAIPTAGSRATTRVVLVSLDHLLIFSGPTTAIPTVSVALLPPEDSGFIPRSDECPAAPTSAGEPGAPQFGELLLSVPLPAALSNVTTCDISGDVLALSFKLPEEHCRQFTFTTAAAATSFVKVLQTLSEYHTGEKLPITRVSKPSQIVPSCVGSHTADATTAAVIPHLLWLQCNVNAKIGGERLAHVKSTFTAVDAATKVTVSDVKDATTEALTKQRRECKILQNHVDDLHRKVAMEAAKADVCYRIEQQTETVLRAVRAEEEELRCIEKHLTDEVKQWQEYAGHKQQEELRAQRRQQQLEQDRLAVETDLVDQRRSIDKKRRVFEQKLAAFQDDHYRNLEEELARLESDTAGLNAEAEVIERRLSRVSRKHLAADVDRTLEEYSALQKVAVDDEGAVEAAFDACRQAKFDHEALQRECELATDDLAIAHAAMTTHKAALSEEEAKLTQALESLVPLEKQLQDLQTNREFFFAARDQKREAESERREAEQEWATTKADNRDRSVSLAQELFRHKLKIRSASAADPSLLLM